MATTYPRALAPRERQVAALVAEGFRNREIAARLGTGEKTVRSQIGDICQKLGLLTGNRRVAITRWVLHGGLAPSRDG